MSFALLQTDSEKPTLNQLKRAFRALPSLRDLDAVTSFNDAYGIIWRGLELPAAQTLQSALEKEEVPARIVAEAELPILPLGRAAVKLQFHPEHFEATDPLERVVRVGWDRLWLVAAGGIEPGPIAKPRRAAEAKGEAHATGEEGRHWLCDLFLTGGKDRFTVDAGRFDFSYLGPRQTDEPGKNLAYLVQDLAQFAPGAGLSRGALQFCEQPQCPHCYPRKSAYVEEITWMLWLSGERAAAGPG